MGINVKALAEYAKVCGVKSILQTTKPETLKGVDFGGLKLQRLTSDVVEIGKGKFSKLEQKMMDSIRGLKVEDARVIDQHGKLVKDLKFVGDELGCRLDPEQFEKIEFWTETMSKFKNSTYIHNHPFNAVLSANDIYVMALSNIKKMTACMKDGGYSYLERLSPEQDKLFKKAAASLIGKESAQIKKLARTRGITDIERMRRLNDWRKVEINNIAERFGLRFENKIGKLTETDSVPTGAFRTNRVQRFIDNVILSFRKKAA